MGELLEEIVLDSGPELGEVLIAIAKAVDEIQTLLQNADSMASGAVNDFGDNQLQVDLQADEVIRRWLSACRHVESACSEEHPTEQPLGGSGFSVAYDPVDGSSVLSANFSVGSIFGVWPGGRIVSQKGSDMAAAAYALYGPKCVLVVARPQAQQRAGSRLVVEQYELRRCAHGRGVHGDGFGDAERREFVRSRASMQLSKEPQKLYAPANLRAACGNSAFMELISHWLQQQYTLRYTGAAVADIHHILAKGGGIFCNAASPGAPPKLRLAFEAAPLAFVVEAAGGSSHCGVGSVLSQRISSTSDRSLCAVGSRAEVEMCLPALKASLG